MAIVASTMEKRTLERREKGEKFIIQLFLFLGVNWQSYEGEAGGETGDSILQSGVSFKCPCDLRVVNNVKRIITDLRFANRCIKLAQTWFLGTWKNFVFSSFDRLQLL